MKNIPTNKPSLDPLRAAPASVRLSDAEQIDYLIMDAVETRLAKGEPISDMARFKAGCRKAILENEKQYRGYTWKLYQGTKKRREPSIPVAGRTDDELVELAMMTAKKSATLSAEIMGSINERDKDTITDLVLSWLPWNLRSPEIEERIRKELAA